VEDFMPGREKRTAVPSTPDDFIKQIRMLNAAAGGKEVILNG
jgi:hypothetical protein